MTTEYDPLDLVGQARAEADKAEEERLLKGMERSDLCVVMGSKEGRRFMWRLLGLTGVYRSSFNENAAITAFNEGARNIGLILTDQIMDACQNRYTDMLREHKEARERHEQRNADRRNTDR